MPVFGVDTPARESMFLAQALHESAGFTQLAENLDYTAARLVEVFPKHFTPFEAAKYAHRPEAIASRVYASRGENGNEATGDGWRYRGRGIFQVTFRANYANCSRAILADPSRLLHEPDLLAADPDHAIASAVWYWTVNDLNRFADSGDVDACRDLIWRGRRTAAVGDSAGYHHVVALKQQAEAAIA
jgi:putative chitinase